MPGDHFIEEAMRRRIGRELDEIELNYDVHILLAIESGSRAWGFPSPDSDYDVRFVYAYGMETYLSIEPPRDVIERPIDSALDINGWDLRKALRLLVR
jgi:predicted nucleotidyltransferase